MAVEFKNGVIRDGGRCVGNIKNDVIREGPSSSPGSGSQVGKTRDYSMKGADYMDETAKVACYHFLVRKIF